MYLDSRYMSEGGGGFYRDASLVCSTYGNLVLEDETCLFQAHLFLSAHLCKGIFLGELLKLDSEIC